MAMRVAVLCAAAVVVVACGTQPPAKPVEHKPAPVPVAPPPVVHAPNGITIAAVGDIMMGTDYPDNTLPDDDGVGFLAGVAPILSSADITFGNLEGVLMDGGEAVKRCRTAVTKNNKQKVTPSTASAPTTAPAPVKEEAA